MTAGALAGDPVVQTVLRAALSGLLAAAALHKGRDPQGFRRALAGYGLLPPAAVAVGVAVLPLAESFAALSLWLPGAGPARVAPAAALLGLYSAAIGAALLGGRRGIDCGCGGPAARPLGPGLLVRNALWLGAVGVCALPRTDRPLGALDALCVAAGTLALLLLHASAERSLALAPRLRALRSPS